MAEWYDTFTNKFNFIRWADGDGRLLSDIQKPGLYCVGKQSTATTTGFIKEVFENKNNFIRWINLEGRTMSELAEYFCEQDGSGAYSDGYSDGYS